jgi:hypothetical protein
LIFAKKDRKPQKEEPRCTDQENLQ